MSLTNPPTSVSQLSTQLAACAGWVGGATNHWYPAAPNGSTAPFAVLDEVDVRRTRYAADVVGVRGGTLTVTIYDTQAARTIGQLEDFARTIEGQLTAQVSGLIFGDSSISLVDDVQPGALAAEGTAALRCVTITLPYGLEA